LEHDDKKAAKRQPTTTIEKALCLPQHYVNNKQINQLKKATMTLLQRARESGACPPSLLSESALTSEDGFEEAVLKILDPNGELTVMVVFHVDLPLNLYRTRFLSQHPRLLLHLFMLYRLFLGIQRKCR
jgi:hypothetical protein